MALSKKAANLINNAGKEIAEKGIREMIKRNGKVNNIMSDYCNIKGENVQIHCPYNIQKYSMSFSLKDKSPPSSLKFDFGTVNDVALRSIEELKNYKEAINILDIGFTLDLRKLPKDTDYLIDVEFQMEDGRFIKSFVNTDKAKDTPFNEDEEVSKYWLEALLKHPNLLKDEYRSVDLRDVNVGVNVSLGQDINMKIPGTLKEKLAVMVKMNKGAGRSETIKNAMRLYTLQRGKYGGDSIDILDSIQDFFTASVFSDFVDIKQDFSYYNCIRGEDFHERLPLYSWPKFMTVLSRCNLGLDKPAAVGTLEYKKKDFISELSKILKIDK